jgi:hypothetical protein
MYSGGQFKKDLSELAPFGASRCDHKHIGIDKTY